MALTQSEIAQMAHAAGFHRRHTEPNEWWGYTDAFERFAEIVAARAAKEEREACANVAFAADHMGSVNLKLLKNRIGNAIRARGDV